jgi:hypothetical protein
MFCSCAAKGDVARRGSSRGACSVLVQARFQQELGVLKKSLITCFPEELPHIGMYLLYRCLGESQSSLVVIKISTSAL